MLLFDPIHGDIELTSLEAAVLELPMMQRLRGIKQLGTAHLVYPGTLHTRFDHSIGVCAVAHWIVTSLRRSGLQIPAELGDAIGVAALFHDALTPIICTTALAGIELMYRIRKGQFNLAGLRLKDTAAPAVWNAVISIQ